MIPVHTTALTQEQKNDVAALVKACKEKEPLALAAPDEDGLDYFLLYGKGPSRFLLGFAFLFFPEKTCCECAVFVHPDYRRRGLCSRMLERALAHVDEREKRDLCQIDFCFLVDSSTPSACAAMEALEAEYWYSEYKMARELNESDTAYTPALAIAQAQTGVYTAALDGEAIGSCAVLASNQEAYLYAFQIKEAYQGQGHGKDFLLGMLSLLSSHNRKASVQVSGQNYIARNLYKKTGFHTVEALSYYLY